MKFKTEQELFWVGSFGNQYIKRNDNTNRMLTIGKNLLTNNVKVNNVIELGANTGSNLDTIKKIYPNTSVLGVEINKKAYKILKNKHNSVNRGF